MSEIGFYMKSSFSRISAWQTLEEAIFVFHAQKTEVVLIHDPYSPNRFLGILCKEDLRKKIQRKNLDPATILVKDVMVQPIPALDQHSSTKEASLMMFKYNINYIGVTDNNRIVGVLASEDLIADFFKKF